MLCRPQRVPCLDEMHTSIDSTDKNRGLSLFPLHLGYGRTVLVAIVILSQTCGCAGVVMGTDQIDKALEANLTKAFCVPVQQRDSSSEQRSGGV